MIEDIPEVIFYFPREFLGHRGIERFKRLPNPKYPLVASYRS